MESTSAGPELPDERNKSAAAPLHKPGRGKRLKAKYTTSTSNPSPTVVSGILLNEGVQSVKAGDPVTTEKRISEREPSRKKLKRGITLGTAVYAEELSIENGPSIPIKVEDDPSVPPTEKLLKNKDVPLIGRRRKTIALISVIIMCVVVFMSIMAASGVVKKDDTNGNDDGNVVRTALANVMKAESIFYSSPKIMICCLVRGNREWTIVRQLCPHRHLALQPLRQKLQQLDLLLIPQLGLPLWQKLQQLDLLRIPQLGLLVP
jgi:hypothetical protein